MDITRDAGYEEALEINQPKSSVIIDGNNGQLLWAQNPDLPREPASISKMMTVFLVFDAIKQGKMTLDTTITATEKDEAISQIYLISNSKIQAGVDYPIKELLKMVTVPSSNVATVMLANYVSDGDAGGFVQSMNEKAKEIGMTNTTFYNCSGASANSFEGLYAPKGFDPAGSNMSTARDLATMVFYLINDHPEVLAFTNQPIVTTMEGTPYEESFETYNYSLPGAKYGLEGVDGLKTGSGPSSAFNYIATAKRGKTRLIEVIMGVGTWEDQDGEYYRHPFGNALLEKTFDEYEYRQLLPKGKHTIQGKEVQLDQDFYGVVKKGTDPVFALQDQHITLSQPMEQAAETMPPLAVKYQKTEHKEAVIDQQEDGLLRKLPHFFLMFIERTRFLSKPLYLIGLTWIGLFLLLVSLIVGRANRHRRRSIVSVLFCLIGILCFITAAGVFITAYIL
nr:DUF1958 domain-containing protein [Enterococcus florum]